MKPVILAMLAFAMAVGVTVHAQAARTQTVTGVVTGVSDSSLTIVTAGHDMAFAVAPSTRVIGKGRPYNDLVLRPPRKFVDMVKPGDRVTVTYRVSGSAMNAVDVRVRR